MKFQGVLYIFAYILAVKRKRRKVRGEFDSRLIFDYISSSNSRLGARTETAPLRTRCRVSKYCTGPNGHPRIVYAQIANPYRRASFHPCAFSGYPRILICYFDPITRDLLKSKMVVEVSRIPNLYFSRLSSSTDSFQKVKRTVKLITEQATIPYVCRSHSINCVIIEILTFTQATASPRSRAFQ